MNRTVKKVLLLILTMSLSVACCACGLSGAAAETEGMKLKDIDLDGINTVWLSENGKPTAFAVVDTRYDGKVLLIRREPLEDEVPYRNENVFGSGGGYYPGSDVDIFLNGDYYDRLGQEVRDTIAECSIEVTSQDTVTRGDNRRDTEKIDRKVFLLSLTEMGDAAGGTSMAAKEGKALKNLGQYLTLYPEWLRSAYLWDDVHAWSISSESYGEEAISIPLRVRPAFAMSGETKVVKCDSDEREGFMLAP